MRKKEAERSDLGFFEEAYERVTGLSLGHCLSHESPDFICHRSDGLEVGIELTAVRDPPQIAFFERTYSRKDYMDAAGVADVIYRMAKSKADKRVRNHWPCSSSTILVLQLECPLRSLSEYLEPIWCDDLSALGFLEVWLADYSEIDAYGDVELFGLFPESIWGYHQRFNPLRKPYG